jgi:co-chaperonin GroES (HSP10)
MVKPLKVLGGRVLIQPDKQKERSHGGIIIPVNVNQDIEQAVVLATGDSVIHIKAGDRIMYPAGAGIPFQEANGLDLKFIDGPTKDSPGNIIAII